MQSVIPVNTTAIIHVPATKQIRLNGKPIEENKEVKIKGNQHGYTLVEVGSGTYTFEGMK